MAEDQASDKEMMDAQTIAFVALGITAINFAATWGRDLWRGGGKYRQELAGMESRLSQTLAEIEKDFGERVESTIRMFGETVEGVRRQVELNNVTSKEADAALKDDIRQVEIFMRDEFISKDSFNGVIADLKVTLGDQGRRTESSINTLRSDLLNIFGGKKPNAS